MSGVGVKPREVTSRRLKYGVGLFPNEEQQGEKYVQRWALEKVLSNILRSISGGRGGVVGKKRPVLSRQSKSFPE